MELDMSLLWAVLSIVVPIIASIIFASIAIANHLGKRIDAVNKRIDDMNTRIDDMNTRIDDLRSEMVRGIDALRSEMNRGVDNLNKRIDDMRTDLGKWTEIMEADIRELRAPIFAQASGKADPNGSNFRKQASAAKRAGGG